MDVCRFWEGGGRAQRGKDMGEGGSEIILLMGEVNAAGR
jgi:hypothetical protein